MKLKIPPVAQTLISVIAMFIVKKMLPNNLLGFYGNDYIALLFMVIAIYIGILSLVAFYKTRTSVNPLDPKKASKLVVNGIYMYSRNPMYVALGVGLLAIVLWLENIFNILILIFFIWYITIFQIKPEEIALRAKFGEDFIRYMQHVRRWI